MKNTKGITLLALVITIIVLLILAGVTLSVVFNGGIIDKSQNAVDRYSNSSEFEENKIENIAAKFDDLYKDIFLYNEAENIKISDISTVAEAKLKNAVEVTTGITILKDDNNLDVKIPAKFHIASDSATKIEDGIVIEDSQGNQFVWIPVDVPENYTRIAFGSAIQDIVDETTGSIQIKNSKYSTFYYIEEMPIDELTSITINKGYYIGRYEAGDSTKPTMTGGIYRTNSTQINPLVIKKGYAPYVYISKSNAKTLAETMDTTQGYSATTKLCSSYAWDTAINFIQEKISDYATNSPQGNYSDVAAFTYTDITGIIQNNVPGRIIPTGQTTSVCNIYDMGGNVFEWTTEYCSYESQYTTMPCTIRSFSYDNLYSYSKDAAGGRSYYWEDAMDNIGFRVALFL